MASGGGILNNWDIGAGLGISNLAIFLTGIGYLITLVNRVNALEFAKKNTEDDQKSLTQDHKEAETRLSNLEGRTSALELAQKGTDDDQKKQDTLLDRIFTQMNENHREVIERLSHLEGRAK